MPRQKSSFTQRDIDARREIGLGPRNAIPVLPPHDGLSVGSAKEIPRVLEVTKSEREAAIDSKARKLVPRAIPGPARDEFAQRLSFFLKDHLLRACADEQERPTKVLRTLKAGLGPARSLLEFFDALPMSMRQRLGAVGVENLLSELKTNIQKECRYWSRHKVRHRPPEARQLWHYLRDDLYALYSEHHPDDTDPDENARKRRQRERQFHLQRRRWAAQVMRSIDVKFPDEKKNPGLFEAGLRALSANR
jgi:hypothetical protein